MYGPRRFTYFYIGMPVGNWVKQLYQKCETWSKRAEEAFQKRNEESVENKPLKNILNTLEKAGTASRNMRTHAMNHPIASRISGQWDPSFDYTLYDSDVHRIMHIITI